MVNKHSQNLIDAYNKGYKVIKGIVFYNSNELKQTIDKSGYNKFSIRNKEGNQCIVYTHRLVAYQKFGDKIFEKGIHVRHLDSNSLNNHDDNILIGTPSENSFDRSESERLKSAIVASYTIKKHDHEKILKLHSEGKSYKQIMELLGIKSKGTISFIIKKSIETKKKNAEVAQLVEQQTENLRVGGSIPPLCT